MNNQRQLVYKVGEQVETTLRGWKVGRSKEKGTPYLRLVFDKYISKDLWLTEKNKENVVKILEIFGYKGPNLGVLDNDNALDREKIVFAVIEEVRPYNGKNYYNASFINDPDKQFGGWDDKEATPDLMSDLKSFDTRAYHDGDSAQSSSDSYDPPAHTDADFAASDIPF